MKVWEQTQENAIQRSDLYSCTDFAASGQDAIAMVFFFLLCVISRVRAKTSDLGVGCSSSAQVHPTTCRCCGYQSTSILPSIDQDTFNLGRRRSQPRV